MEINYGGINVKNDRIFRNLVGVYLRLVTGVLQTEQFLYFKRA